MVPGGYSVTINWAPPEGRPVFDFGAAFLLRQVLETCDSYSAAVDAIKSAPLASSAFYTVCGVNRGEGCVIERIQRENVVRKIGHKDVLVQANHYQSTAFDWLNDSIHMLEEDEDDDTETLLEDSEERQAVLEDRLSLVPNGANLGRVAKALECFPVRHSDTHQKMVFCPATGEMKVWRSA
jgi:hypothetical protein